MAEQPDDDRTQTHVVLTKGTMVGHYRIVEKIGAGGMGEVYLAEDTELDRKVALKFLSPHLCQDEDCRARFKREAQAAARLSHSNIVTIFEVSEHQGRPFFAMEHVEGQSLRDHAKARELEIEQVVNLAVQLCDGLNAAHDQKIVHRDIKPSNIVIDAYGRPKILDFGLAAVHGGEHLTKTGSTLGTVGYMSPEQIEGKETDARSDLFSLGVVLYELIAGKAPFRRNDEAATLKAILGDTQEPLARYKSDVPDELQRIITKLMEKDPNLRYQSAAGVIPDLRQLRRRSDSDAAAGKLIRKRHRGLMRVVTPVGLAVVVTLVLILKPWRFEISPSQEAIAAENRLVIMYFDNLADPEDSQKLGEIAANLLITDLTESQYLDVVSSQRLYDILKLLGREGEKRIDPDIATEVATKARAKWMLQGSILRVEPQLIVTSQLIDVESGSAVASQRVTGEAGDDIFTLVDKLTVEIKGDLALPAVALEEVDRAVADVTTHSPEAYRRYLEGRDYYEMYYNTEALNSFREALEFDSTFAMAHFWLARVAPSEEEKRRAMARALEYSDRVSEKERWYIEAVDAAFSEQYEDYIRGLERILQRYPKEKLALLLLGNAYATVYETDEAIGCFKRVIEIDPLNKEAYNSLAYRYQEIGDYEQALWAINKYIELAPDEANPYDSRGEIYAANGQLDKAVESFQKALEIKPDFYGSARSLGDIHVLRGEYDKAESYYHVRASHVDATQRGWGRLDLVRILLHQGKFQEALRRLDVGIETDRIELGDSWPAVSKIQRKAMIYFWFLEDYSAALEEAELLKSVVDIIDPGNSSWALWHRGFTASASARKGNLREADSLIALMKRETDTTGARHSADNYLFWLALNEFAEENYDAAAALWEQIYQRDQSSSTMGFLGLSYLGAGRVGDAVDMSERSLQKYDASYLRWPGMFVLAHYYLGQAYEQSGWTDKAIEQYEIFLDTWKNADSGLTSVEEARSRLAKLKADS